MTEICSSVVFHIIRLSLFSRLRLTQPDEKRGVLWRFIKRNLCFYLFWFIVLAPITFYCTHFFENGAAKGILLLVQATLFSSTFFSSWFLSALIIGTIIVFYASKVIWWKGLLALALVIYALVCFRSSYWHFVPENSFLNSAANAYVLVFTEPYKSFPAAILWIVIGKMFAENKIAPGKTKSFMILALGSVLLYAEWLFVKYTEDGARNDCYFMLLPFCVGVFSVIRLYDGKSFARDTRNIRRASAITYASHGSIAAVISAATNSLFM